MMKIKNKSANICTNTKNYSNIPTENKTSNVTSQSLQISPVFHFFH